MLIMENPMLLVLSYSLGALVLCPARHDRFWFGVVLWATFVSTVGVFM